MRFASPDLQETLTGAGALNAIPLRIHPDGDEYMTWAQAKLMSAAVTGRAWLALSA